jgi:hypothetical protein
VHLHTKPTTQMMGEFKQGDRIEAKVNAENQCAVDPLGPMNGWRVPLPRPLLHRLAHADDEPALASAHGSSSARTAEAVRLDSDILPEASRAACLALLP